MKVDKNAERALSLKKRCTNGLNSMLINLKNLVRNFLEGFEPKPDLMFLPRTRSRPPKYYLTAVIIVKDEELYLDEWINFHLLVGCEHFYFYDNNSSDKTGEILEKYARKGLVTKQIWKKTQRSAYFDALRRYAEDSRWMMFIDMDEFVFPTKADSLRDVLTSLEAFPGIVLPWHMFGNSGHLNRPDGLVIENYSYRSMVPNSKLRQYVNTLTRPKSIVDPIQVRTVEVHTFENFSDTKNVTSSGEVWDRKDWVPSDEEPIVINHYYSRSKAEFEDKLEKRRKSKIYRLLPHNEAKMRQIVDAINEASIEDLRIQRFVEPLKKSLGGN